MIFDKKRTTVDYVIEQCCQCENIRKRRFEEGDFLFKETTKCEECKNPMLIEKIFGEEEES